MIDLPTRARVLRAENGLWVRALQRADHEAGALSSGGADAGVAPTSTNGRSCLASGSHVGHGATYRGLTLRPSCDVQRRCTVTSAGRAARQPSWRSRVARLFWIRRGTLCDAESNAAFGLGCCRSRPGAAVDQRFISGDMKGMPCGISEVIADYRRTGTVVNSAVREHNPHPTHDVTPGAPGHHVTALVRAARGEHTA
jgi:hypothetical protein